MKLKYDSLLSSVAFKFNWRHYTLENLAVHIKIHNDHAGVAANATGEDYADGNSTVAVDALPSGWEPSDWEAQAPSPSPSATPGLFDNSDSSTQSGLGLFAGRKRVETQFEGTIMLDEALLSKFPNLPGLDTASIFASGQFTVSSSAGFSMDSLKVGRCSLNQVDNPKPCTLNPKP